VTLADRYTLTAGPVYLTGIQALVRLPLDQMRLDRAAGLNTASFISGYEGSPLGGYDLALARERKLLEQHRVHHWPAVNEDLAATAIFGTQILSTLGPANADGVVGIWYGKGPGVDRSGDIFRHANLAGCEGLSAALVLAGDDPSSKSSTIPHQSDFSLMNWGIPVLAPGNTQEMLDLGLAAIALSRHAGCWAGLKLVTEVCDGGGTVDISLTRHRFLTPDTGYAKRTEAVLLAPQSLFLETQTNGPRLDAAIAFAAANQLNQFAGSANARIGIATAGKPYYDLMQAFHDLQLDPSQFRIAKYGMTFPVDPAFTRRFVEGLDLILVIEEKRSFLEMQIRDALFNLPIRPRVIGKQDLDGQPLLPASGELDPDFLAVALPRVLPLADPRAKTRPAAPTVTVPRMPNFCSGCPHNRSTLLLEGQFAAGGTGCHGMGVLMPDTGRGYQYCTHMGGEGAPWIGQALFSERKHIFQNLGDGTFFHSGSLAVQACIAAGVTITFKLLYNGHVAMTGGQQATGVLAVPELTRRLEADGVKRIVVLAEDPRQYQEYRIRFSEKAEIRDRFELETVLKELEQTPGVSVLIYDQECAAEKRRARTRGKAAEPTTRLVINERVCEGCGDCVKQSNCMSLQPVDTPFGQKMSIHQSSCNKDYTCALGDCPAFVTVEIAPGTGLPKPKLPTLPATQVPEPDSIAPLDQPYRIVSPGIGGTGVITIHAVLATAAWIEGLHALTLDQTGLAQKGGAVVSHLTLSRQPIALAAKVNSGNADLILGFDLLGVAAAGAFKTLDPSRTRAVINSRVTPPSEAIRKRLTLLGEESTARKIEEQTRESAFFDATRLGEELFGSHLAVNVFLLGYAWQAGWIPLRRESIEEAIRLNGAEADRNLQAFLWGRRHRVDPVTPASKGVKAPADFIAEFWAELHAYQGRAYADQWRAFVDAQPEAIRETVAAGLFKLMAYKDEYEVARLLTEGSFESGLNQQFEAVRWHGYQLHPPILRALGWKRKIAFGPWMRPWLKLLAAGKFLRGTPFDLFGYARHRREERELIGWYRDLVTQLAPDVNKDTASEIRAILSAPDQIRGYDEIKSRSIAQAKRFTSEQLEKRGRVKLAPEPAPHS
jgi:indolepyruvate ferredoxin oxidoreductase